MGFFSKKDYVCEKCGKTFQKRVSSNLCDECKQQEEKERRELEEATRGYFLYGLSVLPESFTTEELKQIVKHREDILSRYKQDLGISREELQTASDNYKKLTDEQAMDVLVRAGRSAISSTIGAFYSDNFFVPTNYGETIVDAKDVFAVGYTTDYKLIAGSDEVILCAVFTNDPYIPVFSIVFSGKTRFFELMKSKRGRESTNALFEALCPNLQYPVGDIKELKKQIKQDGSVRGNIDMQFMLDQISNASYGKGIFNTKEMLSELWPESTQMLDRFGYIPDKDIDAILQMDKMFNRNYWNEIASKLK